VVLLKFKNGALGTIDNSRRAVYGYDQRVEVFGSEGCAAAGNKIPTEVTLHNADSTMSDKPLYFFFFLERYEEAYLAEMRESINCIQENRVPAVGGFDGKVSVAMGYAAGIPEERKFCASQIIKWYGSAQSHSPSGGMIQLKMVLQQKEVVRWQKR
jgi:predicted dehydrogenase